MDINATIVFDLQYVTQMGITSILKDVIELPSIAINTKKEMIQSLTESPSSLIIMDFSLTDFSSTDELHNLIARFPDSKWLFFSEDFNSLFVKRLLHTNTVVSFLLKSSSKEDINTCIKSVINGHNYLSPLLNNLIETEEEPTKEKLTLTESEILKEIANGLSAKQVAQKRNASVHTIITHKKNIYRKLQINTIQEAYIYAMRSGILNINDYAI